MPDVEISLDIGDLNQHQVNSNISNNAELNNTNTYRPNKESPRKILLFDGVCNVCDGFVQFLFAKDHSKIFSYQALQSEKGREILNYYGITSDLSTVVLVNEETGTYLTKSSAILTSCYYLGAPYNYLYGFSYIPGLIRDFCYNHFASVRYLVMGKKDFCMFSVELRNRFIDFKSPMILDEEDETKEM